MGRFGRARDAGYTQPSPVWLDVTAACGAAQAAEGMCLQRGFDTDGIFKTPPCPSSIPPLPWRAHLSCTRLRACTVPRAPMSALPPSTECDARPRGWGGGEGRGGQGWVREAE